MIEVLVSAVAALVTAASLPPPVIDNDFVTIWDLTLKARESLPQISVDEKRVALVLEGGTFKISRTEKRVKNMVSAFGDAIVFPA